MDSYNITLTVSEIKTLLEAIYLAGRYDDALSDAHSHITDDDTIQLNKKIEKNRKAFSKIRQRLKKLNDKPI